MKFKTEGELRAFFMGMCHERELRNAEVMRECGHSEGEIEAMRQNVREAFEATFEEASSCLECAREMFDAPDVVH